MTDTTSENLGDKAEASPRPVPAKPTLGLSLAALGIVFGDIGTSPLYAMKTVLADTGNHPDPATTLGLLSLLVWTLVIVASLKYVSLAMRIDNEGEGGILALMSLIGIKHGYRPVIVAMGLFGAALIYGDGAITPAISVLSAIEGLHLVIPSFDAYVLPTAVTVLVVLFALQFKGTATIGRVFGPVMATWFLVLAAMGLYGISRHPAVLAGLSPTYAISYLAHGGFKAFALLGSVFLCVTGAEALYADMGHFGKRPIWLAWFSVVFPALILNYAGQAAIVLAGASVEDNIFYRLCPTVLLVPLILLATAATIIASQAIITGAFSMTRQAIQLGWIPHLVIRQTSEEGYGQIYIGGVNWLLMAATIGLALAFKKSDGLASAYGIAVSATMLVTSILLYLAIREVLGWPVVVTGAIVVIFLTVDLAFFSSNLLKLLDGGWIPLVLAAMVFGLMRVWHAGIAAIVRTNEAAEQPIDVFFRQLEENGVVRPEGTGVFLSKVHEKTPPLLAWHVRQNRSLYRNVLILTVGTAQVPRVASADRCAVEQLCPNVWRATMKNGFMDHLDLASLPAYLKTHGCDLDVDGMVFYVGHSTIARAERGRRVLNGPTVLLFSVLMRNQAHLTDVLGLPSDRVIEIGRRIEL